MTKEKNKNNKKKYINKKQIKSIQLISVLIIIFLINIFSRNTYALTVESLADGTKDITGILLVAFIAIGVVLILLCLAIIVKINTLKKIAKIINDYIEKFGMPDGYNNGYNIDGRNKPRYY